MSQMDELIEEYNKTNDELGVALKKHEELAHLAYFYHKMNLHNNYSETMNQLDFYRNKIADLNLMLAEIEEMIKKEPLYIPKKEPDGPPTFF